jgi:CheY-like chemotaxis protein
MNYPPRILIVDDDPYVLNSLKRLLSSRGHEATVSYNGHDAKAFWEKSIEAGSVSGGKTSLLKKNGDTVIMEINAGPIRSGHY